MQSEYELFSAFETGISRKFCMSIVGFLIALQVSTSLTRRSSRSLLRLQSKRKAIHWLKAAKHYVCLQQHQVPSTVDEVVSCELEAHSKFLRMLQAETVFKHLLLLGLCDGELNDFAQRFVEGRDCDEGHESVEVQKEFEEQMQGFIERRVEAHDDKDELQSKPIASS